MGSIIGFFQTLWAVIVNAFQSVLMAYRMVVGSAQFIATFLAYIPAVIASGIIIFIAVFAIRFLLLK